MGPHLVTIFAVVLLATGSGGSQTQVQAPPRARVLFVGNSLTYVNNLPAMIEALAAQVGLKGRVTCRAVALPNFGLEEHWNSGEAVRAIEQRNWTLVVLQQGPTSLPESQAILREYTRKFAFEIKKTGAPVALYSVWPPRGRMASFDAVTASYVRAAEDVGGTVVPVGEGWRAAWRRDAALPLYGADGFHPSPMGTYLGALMFLEQLTGRSPIGLPPPSESKDKVLREIVVSPAQLTILQEAAAEANAKFTARTPVEAAAATPERTVPSRTAQSNRRSTRRW
jgi:hypothetical protein